MKIFQQKTRYNSMNINLMNTTDIYNVFYSIICFKIQCFRSVNLYNESTLNYDGSEYILPHIWKYLFSIISLRMLTLDGKTLNISEVYS